MPPPDTTTPQGLSFVSVAGVGDDGTVFGAGGTVVSGTPVIWGRK